MSLSVSVLCDTIVLVKIVEIFSFFLSKEENWDNLDVSKEETELWLNFIYYDSHKESVYKKC